MQLAYRRPAPWIRRQKRSLTAALPATPAQASPTFRKQWSSVRSDKSRKDAVIAANVGRCFARRQFEHGCHAQIARRVTLSQPDGVAVTPKSAANSPCPALTKRGASRSSRTLGAGCDGRFGNARRACQRGQQNRVVPTPRRWCQVSRKFREATVAIKPGTPGRARYKLLTPSRREGRVKPANLW